MSPSTMSPQRSRRPDVTYFLDTDHIGDGRGEDLVEYFEGLHWRRSRFAMTASPNLSPRIATPA